MDGLRMMMYIAAAGAYLIDREFRFRKLKQGSFYHKMFASAKQETLLDGELIWDEQQNMKYMVFDCALWYGSSVVDSPLSQRLSCVRLMAQACHQDPVARDGTGLPMFAKRMVLASYTESLFQKMTQVHDGYFYQDGDCGGNEISFGEETAPVLGTRYTTTADGLVFMKEDAACGFHFRPSNSLLKWKLVHTVDIMARINSARQSDANPATLLVETYHFGPRFEGVLKFKTVEVEGDMWQEILAARAEHLAQGPAHLKAPQQARQEGEEAEMATVCLECEWMPGAGSGEGKWKVERGRPEKSKPNAERTILETIKVIDEALDQGEVLRILRGTGAVDTDVGAVDMGPLLHPEPTYVPASEYVYVRDEDDTSSSSNDNYCISSSSSDSSSSSTSSSSSSSSNSSASHVSGALPVSSIPRNSSSSSSSSKSSSSSNLPRGAPSQKPKNSICHQSMVDVCHECVGLVDQWRKNATLELEGPRVFCLFRLILFDLMCFLFASLVCCVCCLTLRRCNSNGFVETSPIRDLQVE
jgi:hypothetical protein